MDQLHARYPFLSDAREAVETADVDLVAVVGRDGEILARAMERIETALEDGAVGSQHRRPRVELLSYPVARVLVSLVDEHVLTRKYTRAEAATARERFERERTETTELKSTRSRSLTLSDLLAEFDLDAEITGTADGYRVDVGAYLDLAADERGDEWRLVNRDLQDGELSLTEAELLVLVQQAIRSRVGDGLPLSVPDVIADELTDEAEQIRELLADLELTREIDTVVPELFPPCMRHLLDQVQKGEHLEHHSRFAIAAFLTSIGMSTDEIVELFQVNPGFGEEVTRYQVDHIRGRPARRSTRHRRVRRCSPTATVSTWTTAVSRSLTRWPTTSGRWTTPTTTRSSTGEKPSPRPPDLVSAARASPSPSCPEVYTAPSPNLNMNDTPESGTRLMPDDAFGALGNEIRIDILRALGEADGALSFSELFDQIDLSDSAQFNYHLDKLVGHFVQKDEDGYALRRAGHRVIEAVLSGAVTDNPQLEKTAVDEACYYCGSGLEIEWRGSSIELFCTGCGGLWERSYGRAGGPEQADSGYLGRFPFPPAGLEDREPLEALQAAYTWANLEFMSLSAGICPRCSATLDLSLRLCEDHDATDGPCDSCETGYAVRAVFDCTNCIFTTGSGAFLGLLANTELLSFFTAHGINPSDPESIRRADAAKMEYDETIHSTDPFEGTLTFRVDGDSISLRVDENLDVVDVTKTSG